MSHLEKEIGEQPAVLARVLAEQRETARKLATWLKRTNFSHIFIVARGSSDNAALYAKYLFGMHNRIVVALAAPSMFTMYEKPPALDGAAVLAISQS
ncbi:MAG: glucosamine--fructose-6-phosphate aminotransferase, partial [Deltaproteobacteria bacterium]